MSDIFNRPVIDRFWGEHEFLSNFYRKGFTWCGLFWPTSEHAYQAQKCLNHADYVKFTDPAMTPGQAKRLGQRVEMQPDWDSIRVEAMIEIVTAKFEDPELAARLLATGDAILIEGNTWGDKFWGQCNGEGENNLGKILEFVRRNLQTEAAG